MQGNTSVVVRDMKPGEEKTLLHMARQAFVHSPMEQLGISKPKAALVAEVNGEIAGAMFLHVYSAANKKTGYLDVGFVAKQYRGLGIGRQLYPAATQRLVEMGCEPVAAMVIDDNVASWKSLENQGFGTPSLTGLVRKLGFGRFLRLWLQTLFCIACGANFWMSGPVKKRSSAQEFASFLLVNLLLFLPRLLQLTARPDELVNTLLAYPAVLALGAVFGALGCLAARGAWRFSFVRGGLLLTLLLSSFGTVFPMVGRWYLKEPQATKESRRALGVQAMVEWVGMLLLFCLGAFLVQQTAFFYHCAAIAANLLVYRLIPFMPFGSFGGGRVWGWNKAAFAALAVATAALLFVVIF